MFSYVTSLNTDEILLKSSNVCFSYDDENANYKTKTVFHNNNDFEYNSDCNDPCAVFTNECMNNLEMCNNLYKRNTAIFHSLVSMF